jgi:GT2 family glycosyltransferase
MSNVSWVVCTYNRTKLTEEFLDHNLSCMGVSERPELIWVDNGSTDGIERLWEKYKPEVIIKRANDCLSKSKNAAYALCRGDWVIDLENDFFMPNDWLKEMLEYGEAIPNTGIMATKVSGWEEILKLEYSTPITNINGKNVQICRAFGARMFSKELFKRVGFLIETYGLYGGEDREISDRSAKAGLTNYIIPSMVAVHGGVGIWDSGEYRKKKDEGLASPKINLPEGQLYFNPYITNLNK